MPDDISEIWHSEMLNKSYQYYTQIQDDINKGIYNSNNYAQISEYQYLLKQLR